VGGGEGGGGGGGGGVVSIPAPPLFLSREHKPKAGGRLICDLLQASLAVAHVSVLHTEAVSLLVDAEPNTLKQTKSIIEAARNGKSIYTCRLDLINIKRCYYPASLVHHIRLLLVVYFQDGRKW